MSWIGELALDLDGSGGLLSFLLKLKFVLRLVFSNEVGGDGEWDGEERRSSDGWDEGWVGIESEGDDSGEDVVD